jgi:hypothetical protein
MLGVISLVWLSHLTWCQSILAWCLLWWEGRLHQWASCHVQDHLTLDHLQVIYTLFFCIDHIHVAFGFSNMRQISFLWPVQHQVTLAYFFNPDLNLFNLTEMDHRSSINFSGGSNTCGIWSTIEISIFGHLPLIHEKMSPEMYKNYPPNPAQIFCVINPCHLTQFGDFPFMTGIYRIYLLEQILRDNTRPTCSGCKSGLIVHLMKIRLTKFSWGSVQHSKCCEQNLILFLGQLIFSY